MRLARHVLAVLALCLIVAPAPAQAQLTPETIGGFGGTFEATPEMGAARPKGTSNAVTVVYDNTASAPNIGVSSTDLTAVWGDRTFMTGAGLLSTHRFTVFNSGANGGGALLTAQVAVDFYDGPTSVFIGGYIVNVTFGAGLGPNFFSIVTVTGIDPLLINLPSDVIVAQTVLAMTGTANRLGIASLDPVTIGSSPPSMYVDAATIGGGVPGFYTFGAPPANPGYQMGLEQPPVGTTAHTWGQIKKLYR